MKKNFLTVIAMMVVAFFVSTEIAKAADVTFSGQVRTRWEAQEQFAGGGAAGTPAGNNQTDDSVFSSVRLAATANVNETTKAFIQMQSTRGWGENDGTTGNGAGSGNASNTVNDGDASVGVHQAYMQFKNFLNLPLGFDAKIGRQEVLLDGWRLFGNTIWTPGMQSHDMVRLDHKHDNTSVTLGYILRSESGRQTDPADHDDQDVWMAYMQQKGVLGGALSLYFVHADDQCGTRCRETVINTVGFRQAGKMAGFDYRGEFYYQFGEGAGVDHTGTQLAANVTANASGVDYDAYMFGIRIGRTAKNTAMKPGLTVWYDYLSGTTDEDSAAGNYKSFNTVFDTGHKYYGLIDLFLGIGGGGAGGTQGLGLQDFALKGKINPMAGWTLKLDYHWFWTAESVNGNQVATGVATTSADGDFLGNELDITAVTKMNANTKIMIGYSNFTTSSSMRLLKGTGTGANAIRGDDMNWGYVQFDVKF